MIFEKRQYQEDSISASIDYLISDTSNENAINILTTGAGKSVVISRTLSKINDGGTTIVLQPSKEILEQNYAKYRKYGQASIYSASVGEKRIDKVVFATIGSVIDKKHLFKNVKRIVIDECHLVNAEAGMYQEFINFFKGAKVLGYTATPYRLEQAEGGYQLTFLTRSNPRIFHKVIYYVQNQTLFDQGHLSKLRYFSFDIIDRSKLQLNSQNTDFTQASISRYYKSIDMPSRIAQKAISVLSQRQNLLIFCDSIETSILSAKMIPGAVVLSAKATKEDREKILSRFKSGFYKCLINVGVLTTGFDYPGLEAVLIARSTMSLSLYYQIVGRAMRKSPTKKDAWVIDMGGNINLFGKIETMEIRVDLNNRYSIWNNGRQLTNVPLNR